MKYLCLFITLHILILGVPLAAIDIDGNDLDWDYVKKVTIKDISDGVKSDADIRFMRWTMDDEYFYLLINPRKQIRRNNTYLYMLNIDTDFNETADLNLRTGLERTGEIAYVNEYGEISRIEKVGRDSKISMQTGSCVEYRISRSLLGKRFGISCAVWDEEKHEMAEATLWHYVELSQEALEEKGVDINAGIKHFSGKKHGRSRPMKVDGSLADWAAIEYKEVSDKTAFYYQDKNILYIIASKRVLMMSDDMVYYITIDINMDGIDDFLLAVRSDNSGFIQVGNKVYSMDEYEGLEGAVGEQLEFGIPLTLLPEEQFKASIGLWNETTGEIYYYTAWKEYELDEREKEKRTEKEKEKETEKETEKEKEIEKDVEEKIIKRKTRSGIKDLLAGIKDPKLKIQLEKFITQGVEEDFSLDGNSPAKIVKSSYKYRGIPYIYGRADAGGTDCSGLTYMIFRDFDIILSRSAQVQARTGTIIASRKDLQPGDLVFFYRTYPTSNLITHVGLYLGDNKFINANSYYKQVMVEDIYDKYWDDKFIFGTRGQ